MKVCLQHMPQHKTKMLQHMHRICINRHMHTPSHSIKTPKKLCYSITPQMKVCYSICRSIKTKCYSICCGICTSTCYSIFITWQKLRKLLSIKLFRAISKLRKKRCNLHSHAYAHARTDPMSRYPICSSYQFNK